VSSSGLVECRLPNGMEIRGVSPAEAAGQYEEIFNQRIWLAGGLELRDGDTVVDVGANIGMSTLFFHHERRGVRLLSFEPAPTPFAALRHNVEAFGVDAVCRPVALGASAHRASLSYYPDVTPMSGLYAEPAEDAAVARIQLRNAGVSPADIADLVPGEFPRDIVEVEVRTLAEEVRAAGLREISLLKIDVEKSEVDVLVGIDAATWAMVQQVTLEIHDRDDALRTARELLTAQGFTVQGRQPPPMHGTPVHFMSATRTPQP
jgi:31-O-methyltransferase